MKVLERTADRLVLGMGAQEKVVLERLLAFYPLGPDRPPTLSRGGVGVSPEAVELLQEGLRDQRTELSAWLRRRLEEGAALERDGKGWKLSLDSADSDRLLRILNEMRIGAWVRLGCPEEIHEEPSETSPGEAPFFVIMTLAGQFEMLLIHALDGGSDGGSGGGVGGEGGDKPKP